MTDKRRGLGRGLGALIPSGAPPLTKPGGDRPVDVFFPGRGPHGADGGGQAAGAVTATLVEERTDPDPAFAGTSEGHQAAVGAGRRPEDVEATGAFEPDVDLHALLPVPGLRFAELPVSHIRPNPRQPRQVFDEDSLAELVHSVREIGVLQPVVVRPAPAPAAGSGESDGPAIAGEAPWSMRYELVMGERRWRAVQLAGLETIPAIIRETSDDDLLRDALLENLHRAELNPLEEAAAYQQLLDDFGCTHEQLATRIGRSRPQISNTLRLLKLPPAVQRRVAAGVLYAGHARALLGLQDTESMEVLAGRIVAEGLSVRAVEEIVALGDGSAKPMRRRPRPGGHMTELNDLASRLGDRLDTRVTVALGRSKGRLSIDFASVDDLNRIIALMAPDVRKAFGDI
ncbi:MAG TPA: ParB/RepB/Spo0J family partition protein [Kineosporiaceae bacterium]|nr:ParB/RepB/Spo0J family partition protein [Kineosporiaceae bacterium]